jgi:DNA-binding NtrC family response regulator
LIVDSSARRARELSELLEGLGFDTGTRIAGEQETRPVGPHREFGAALVSFDPGALDLAETLRRRDPLLPLLVHGPREPSLAETLGLGARRVYHHLLLQSPEHVDRHQDRLRTLADRTVRRRRGARTAPEILGHSAAIEQVRRYVERAGISDANVLVTGESGTGKELVARAIHRHGRRRDGPFVAVNCSAIPEALLESELFGHERGAFTDAIQQSRGRFELADGGTLFFDEIGDMPAALQAKLLRVFQPPPGESPTCREFTRVGGELPMRADARCIFATHRDLIALTDQGRFREDLLQRLDVLQVRVPPLRERKEDIAQLAEVFLERACRRERRQPLELDPLVSAVLVHHDHPRNVRELEGIIESIVVLKESDDPIVLGDLPGELFRPGPEPASGWIASDDPGVPFPTLEQAIAVHVRQAMQRSGGNKSLAARLLGVARPTLDRRLKRADELDRDDA